jgi:hypothetical protein
LTFFRSPSDLRPFFDAVSFSTAIASESENGVMLKSVWPRFS